MMLKPDKDRLDYGELLSPPIGYETVFAVGTTYGLDLDALIAISISLGLSQSIDSEISEDPVYLLQALIETTNKIQIFNESGQIKAPNSINHLHILLEKMVTEIGLENNMSFHPKVWVTKYKNNENKLLYRCIVLSRNLTFDRSWDVAVSLEAHSSQEELYINENKQSKPISNFLESLVMLSKPEGLEQYKKDEIINLSKEISSVDFKINSNTFNNFEFLPTGINNHNIMESTLFNEYDNILIITPFLSKPIIDKFNKQSQNKAIKNIIITRKSELYKLTKENVSNFDIYVMRDIIIDGEDLISGDSNVSALKEITQQDIHAKFYLKTTKNKSELFIGSLNASYNACFNNVEFMLKLEGHKNQLNIDQIKTDIFTNDEKDNPFEKVTLEEIQKPEESINDKLENMIKKVSRMNSSARVVKGSTKYSIEINFEDIEIVNNVSIRPLLSKQEKSLAQFVRVDDLRLLQLSEFYIVKAYEEDLQLERVIKIKTKDLPEEREGQLVNDIIKDENGFIQFVTFILGDDYLSSILENMKGAENSSMFSSGVLQTALYEKMLRAAVHSKGKFKSIKQLLSLISDENIIPSGFSELYAVFEDAIEIFEEADDKYEV